MVTKIESLFSKSNRPEQIIIYRKKNDQGNASGNYFIARCIHNECTDGINMESKILEITSIDNMMTIKNSVSYEFTTIKGDRYRIIFKKPVTFDSIQSNKRHEEHEVKVKVKNNSGLYNDVNVSINTENNTPYSMSMTIDGEIKTFSLSTARFNKDIKIKDICYASYNFYTTDDSETTMEIFVPVSGSIFQILNPNEVIYLKESPMSPCD